MSRAIRWAFLCLFMVSVILAHRRLSRSGRRDRGWRQQAWTGQNTNWMVPNQYWTQQNQNSAQNQNWAQQNQNSAQNQNWAQQNQNWAQQSQNWMMPYQNWGQQIQYWTQQNQNWPQQNQNLERREPNVIEPNQNWGVPRQGNSTLRPPQCLNPQMAMYAMPVMVWLPMPCFNMPCRPMVRPPPPPPKPAVQEQVQEQVQVNPPASKLPEAKLKSISAPVPSQPGPQVDLQQAVGMEENSQTTTKAPRRRFRLFEKLSLIKNISVPTITWKNITLRKTVTVPVTSAPVLVQVAQQADTETGDKGRSRHRQRGRGLFGRSESTF